MGRRANDLLRQARLCLPSPSGSGQPMSRADLAEATNHWLYEQTGKTFTMDANQVGKYERGENRWPHRHYRQALCAILSATHPADIGFYPLRNVGDGSPNVTTSLGHAASDDPLGDRDGGTLDLQVLAFALPAGSTASPAGYAPEVPDMRRRELLTGLAAVGGLAWADPVAAESLRHRITRATADSDQVGLSEWEQIAWDYGTSTATTVPGDLIEDLAVDLALAQEHLGHVRGEADRRVMRRVMAQLCGFLAQATSDLGNPRISLRWWRTAKRLADASAEPSVRVWVRGREIIHGLYDHRPLTTLLDAAEETKAITATPGMGSGSVYAARAQILALLGRPAEALTALDQVSEVFERLPAEIITGPTSAYSWPEVRLWHTASFVHTYLGNTRQAEAAHANALARYPHSESAGCVQVRLHQALSLVRQGDISQGVQHAHLVLDELPAGRRIGMVREVAHDVLRAVPSAERRRGDVAALRHEITQPPATSGEADR